MMIRAMRAVQDDTSEANGVKFQTEEDTALSPSG
jgi:hypothetical protein